jgi:hypothetical protein
MSTPCTDENDEYLYDAVLTAIDHPNRILVFRLARATHRVPATYRVPVTQTSYWTVGSVGRLRLPNQSHGFAFHQYCEERLRRAPDLDDLGKHQWGWRLGERQFTVEAGVLPGVNGAVLRKDTEPLTLELPREFLTFCAECGLQPSTVLRSFIADLCGLFNWTVCPREDHYSSSGSDERTKAKDYFRRAYGWVFYPAYLEQQKSTTPSQRSSDG